MQPSICKFKQVYLLHDEIKSPLITCTLNVSLDSMPYCDISVAVGTDIQTGDSFDPSNIAVGDVVGIFVLYTLNDIDVTKRLFCGIVSNINNHISKTITTVSSEVSIHIVSLTETANALPMINFSYMLPTGRINPFAFSPERNDNELGNLTFEMFQQNIAEASLKAVARFYGTKSLFPNKMITEDRVKTSILDYIDIENKVVSLIKPPNSGMPTFVITCLKKILGNTTPLQAWIDLVTTYFMLTIYPVMNFDADDIKQPIKMGACFFPAWSKNIACSLPLSYTMALKKITFIKLNQRFSASDVIAVAYTPDWNNEKYGSYADQYVFYSEDGELDSVKQPERLSNSRISIQRLPRWLIPGGSGPEMSSDIDVKPIALAYAKTFFAKHNRATKTLRIPVPFHVIFDIVPHLGKVMEITLNDLKTPESDLFGQLIGYTINIALTDNSVSADCCIDIASGRTGTEQNRFAFDDDIIYEVKG